MYVSNQTKLCAEAECYSLLQNRKLLKAGGQFSFISYLFEFRNFKI